MGETFGEFSCGSGGWRQASVFGLLLRRLGLQPSNLSNIEHGRLAPPQDKAKLDEFAEP